MRLRIQAISKRFDTKEVLRESTAVVEQGVLTGLIGRNGAGKTTLFNILYGDLEADAGEAFLEIDGVERPLESKDVGMLFSQPLVPEFLTGYECIRFFLDVHGKESGEHALAEAFELVGLDEEDRHRLIRDYSHGMKNKIMMLMAFLQEPPVILLDEPLTSFDVVLAAEVKRFLREYKRDHIVIMSTHLLDLARDLCDEVILLRDGRLARLPEADLKDPAFEQMIVEALMTTEATGDGDK